MDHEMAAESTSACLDPDAVLEYVEGRASPELRELVEQHASVCTSCRKTLSVLAQSRAPIPADTPTRVQTPMPARRRSPIPDQTIGRYIVRDLLGAGGMGEVYVAHDPELGREVAIKLLAPALGDSEAREIFEARFRREARTLARVAHPNVVAVYDVGRVEDRMFIAMELVEGVTLAKWCRSEPRAPGAILEHFIAAGRGLAAAHAAGIVHRDVKPGNMMLGNDGRVRVVDFGLARAEVEEVTLTVAGAVMGTPHYMAPEQHRGEEADAQSDQFSFCVALYAALYGQFPFEGTDPIAVARAVMNGELREPPRRGDVPRRIWDALRRGMSTNRADRFATLEELLAQIAPAPPTRRLSAVPAIAIGIAVAGALAAAVFAMQARQQPTPAPPVAKRPTSVTSQPTSVTSQPTSVTSQPTSVTSQPSESPPLDAGSLAADRGSAVPTTTPPSRPSGHRTHTKKPVHATDVPIDRGD